MGKYPQTLALLDTLISRLESNTGGESLLPEDSAALEGLKKQEKGINDLIKKEGIKKEKTEVEKKEVPKKKKEEGGKQGKKKDAEALKLPEGADPDLLIFADVDLRISEIVDCWKHPDSASLYCEKIQVGNELRQIASGLQQHVKLQDMKGKVIVMANLKPKPLGGFESNGMVVCASDIDHKNVEILVPDGPIGERLYLQGYQELFEYGEEIMPIMKKKTLQRCIPHFKTDKEGFVAWKGIKVRSKSGYIRSKFIQGNVS